MPEPISTISPVNSFPEPKKVEVAVEESINQLMRQRIAMWATMTTLLNHVQELLRTSENIAVENYNKHKDEQAQWIRVEAGLSLGGGVLGGVLGVAAPFAGPAKDGLEAASKIAPTLTEAGRNFLRADENLAEGRSQIDLNVDRAKASDVRRTFSDAIKGEAQHVSQIQETTARAHDMR